jgi:hypothetical protein
MASASPGRLGEDAVAVGVIADQALETLAVQGARRRQHADHAAAGQRHSRLDARFQRDNRQIDGGPNRLGGRCRRRVAGNDQRLGAVAN